MNRTTQGKIILLKERGLAIGAIALDLGLTFEEVSQAIKDYKKGIIYKGE